MVIAVIVLTIAILALVRSGKQEPGAFLYRKHCESCHLEEGQGLGQLIPPIAGSDWLVHNQDILACIIRYGTTDPMTVNGILYHEKMPGNPELTDGQMVNLINYINTHFGNSIPRQHLREVKETLDKCEDWEMMEL